jgi:hypothetical protein
MFSLSTRQVFAFVNRAMYGALFLLVSALFFTALYTFLVGAQFLALAAVYAPTLALLFGFSSVLYGRARAFPSGPEQRRCLYAAERALQAALLLMVAGALGAVIASFLWALAGKNPAVLKDKISLANWFVLPILLALMAFGAFFMALRAIGHRLLGWVHTRQLVRRIRRAL